MFNDFVEHTLPNRKFTWSNGRRFAVCTSSLVDRFFTNSQWDQSYPSSLVQDGSSFGSDHCPIILHTSAHKVPYTQ